MTTEYITACVDFDGELEFLDHLLKSIREADTIMTIYSHESYARGRTDMLFRILSTDPRWQQVTHVMSEISKAVAERREYLYNEHGVDYRRGI